MKESGNSAPVTALVRTYDRDRYLAGLFAPRRVRDALMGLYAFNCELDRIPAIVTEPSLGEIRLQWWREALENVGSRHVTGNPVADCLTEAITTHSLPKALLLGMIDARSADLDGGGFADMTALNAYFYKTHGALFSLAAAIVGVPTSGIAPLLNAAAEAYGTTRVLLRLPHDAAAGRVMLPLSVLDEHGLTPEGVLVGEGDAIRGVISQLSESTRDALAKCRECLADSPIDVSHVIAPVSVVEPNLWALEKPGLRPLHEVTEINPLVQFFRIWRSSRTGRI